jgi:hypothetical protein
MPDTLGLCIELTGSRASQYEGYDFNSMCKFGDVYLGAGDAGIKVLDSGSLDVAANISAFFELPTSDFGDEHQKRVRAAFLGLEASGSVLFTLKHDDGTSRSYTVTPTLITNKQHMVKVWAGRNGKGRYWMVRIDNVSGSDFSVDAIALLLVLLNRKPSGG